MEVIAPAPLNPGDTVALIAPSYKVQHTEIDYACRRLQALGYKVRVAEGINHEHSCYAGTIPQRVSQISWAFATQNIKAIFAIRGGAGANHLLPYLDYDLIAANPKIFLGSSDITALLNAITYKTGLMTFHGPMPNEPISQFSLRYLTAALTQKFIHFDHRDMHTDDLLTITPAPYTITPGCAKGYLVGGNLSVLTAMLGTDFIYQDWHDKILCVEEVGEPVYRIDRMLAHLKNIGVFDQLTGFIFGSHTRCFTGQHGGFTLKDTLRDCFRNTSIPVFMNSLFGHVAHSFSLPIGGYINMNATTGDFHLTATADEQAKQSAIHQQIFVDRMKET